jgi:very-short-patch-repair endonuclease
MYRDEEQRDFARQLRNNCTTPEAQLWYFLRSGKLGVKFRRQAAIGAYIVDFVCFSHQLIVELDGPQHVTEEGKARDDRRTAWLRSQGYRVMRFRNQMVDEEIQQVVGEIERVLREQVARQDRPPP